MCAFPTTIVSTFQRGGSSLVMQMLQAGGAPVAGAYPDFEGEITRALFDATNAQEWRRATGVAVKRLEPASPPIPPNVAARAIWLDRDPKERARSAAKFLRWASSGEVTPTASNRKTLAASYRAGRTAALEALSAAIGGKKPLILTFESLIRRPQITAEVIANYVGLPFERVDAMANAVRDRAPRCLPDMLEETLVAEMAEGQATA